MLFRSLNRLPIAVIAADSYRHLIELLADRQAAKLIHHADQLTGEYISLLHDLPPPLRRMIGSHGADAWPIEPCGLMDGLRFLVARGAAADIDALVADLSAIRQPDQMIARLANLAERLPLPESSPPAVVGAARRIDGVAAIRQLANQWRNCLADLYLDAINNGRAAVYLWPHAESPAVCVVERHGRLGWALDEIQGPHNVKPPVARLAEMHAAFAAAGIPRDSALQAIECAVRNQAHRAHRRDRRAAQAEIEQLYEQGIVLAP